MKLLIFLLTNFFSLIFYSNVNTFTSISDGDYNSSSTWTFTGTDADSIPDNKDHVIINHNITLQGTSDADYLTVNSSGILNLNNYQMRLWKNNGNLNNGGILNGPGTVRTITNHNISGSGNFNNISFSNDYRLNFNCNLTLNNHYVPPNGSIEIETSSTITLSGTFDCNSSSGYVTNNGTVIINDISNFMKIHKPSNEKFRTISGNLQLPNGGDIPEPDDGGFHNLNLVGTTTSDFSFSVSGDWTNSGTFTSSGSNAVTFDGSSQQNISGTGTSNFEDVIISNANGINISTAGHTMNCSGTVTNQGDLVIEGIFNSTSSTVFSGVSGVQNISGSGTSNFQDISISNSDGINISTAGHTMNCSGTVTNQGDLVIEGIFNSTSSTVFSGVSGVQNISGSGTSNFQDISISNSDGIYISAAGHTLNCAGTFTNSGDLQNDGRLIALGTTIFNGGSQQDISGSGQNTFYNLTLNNSSGLRFVNGTDTIREVLKTDNGSFTNLGAQVILASYADGEAAQLDNLGSNSYFGNLTVERKLVAAAEGYRMLSSPVQSTTLSHWKDDGVLFSGFLGSDYPNASWVNTYYYDEGQVGVGESADSGFVAVSNIIHSTSNYPNLQGTMIYNSAGTNLTLSVEGTPNQGNISQNVSVGEVGWNLIANPYPCNLDWSSFRSSNSSIIGAGGQPHVWNATNGNYETSLSTISHSQGFFIDANISGSLTFQESHKTTSSTSFIKSTNGINLPLELEITGDVNNYKDYAYLKALPNATNNFDFGYDQRKLLTMIPNYSPNIYFKLSDSTILSTNAINNSNSNDILLYSKIGTYAAGNYTISFENLNQFMIGSCITFEDLHTGTITDLRFDSSYTFQSDTTAPFPRFIIHIDVDYNIDVQNPSCYSYNNGNIEINGTDLDSSYFNLFKNDLLLDSIYTYADTLIFDNLNSGNYRLETNHIGNCSLSASEIILIDPEEVKSEFTLNRNTINLDSNHTLVTSNQSTGANYYEWDFGDNSFSNDFSPLHIYNNIGQYFVTLLALDDSSGTCSDVSVELINVTGLSVNSSNKYDKTNNLFYDFFSGNIIFENSLSDNITIELFDINGKKLINKSFFSSSKISLDVSNISKGVYIVYVYSDFGSPITNCKFIIN